MAGRGYIPVLSSRRTQFHWFAAALVWFVGVFGSSFYVFPSGQPQPAHIVLSFAIIISFSKFITPFYFTSAEKRACVFLLIFLYWVIIVNSVWALLYGDAVFLYRASLFMLYSVMLFLSAVHALKYEKIRLALMSAAILGISFILLLWLIGVGRHDFGARYNAFFNDPNQMAFWVICSSCSFLLLARKPKVWPFFIISIVSLILVLLSLSRSALVAEIVMIIGAFLSFGHRADSVKKFNVMKFALVAVLGVLSLSGLLWFIPQDVYLSSIERFLSSDFGGQADVRGYSRLLEFPEYLLFGAGQGLDIRFGSNYEVHSTWAGILFYYGVIGAALFSIYAGSIFLKLGIGQKFIFMAPFVYGLSTYGARTPAFWLFLAASLWAVSHADVGKKTVSRNQNPS